MKKKRPKSLQEFREREPKLSQTEVASELGIFQSQYSIIERGAFTKRINFRIVYDTIRKMKKELLSLQKDVKDVESQAREKNAKIASKKWFQCHECGELIENKAGFCNTCGALYCFECNAPIEFCEASNNEGKCINHKKIKS